MLKYHNFDIVFQEIPDETTLAVNITGCPFRCKGCHSPHLREDTGEPLTREALLAIYDNYSSGVTCIALMGGDAAPEEINDLAGFIKNGMHLKSAWYSGAEKLSGLIDTGNFNFIKIGPYMEEYGGLKSTDTNQRLYSVSDDGSLVDITARIRTVHKHFDR